MCSKNEYTKSESNSQQIRGLNNDNDHCVQRTNIQNLKAIHNTTFVWMVRSILCSKNEYTKSESNSQLVDAEGLGGLYCVQRTNIQNLKAIHNFWWLRVWAFCIVFKERIYKIWKQFTTNTCHQRPPPPLCSKNEYTKSESNSQRPGLWFVLASIVFKERIYKIWKQFTTVLKVPQIAVELCSKNEYTKSESNSQLLRGFRSISIIVFKERIYKIWKQFTTPELLVSWGLLLCSKNEYTKSESNSQPIVPRAYYGTDCVQRTNIQNLKAIHNPNPLFAPLYMIVFKERIYKIWKQFTTYRYGSGRQNTLCSKNEYTKSESNSQQRSQVIGYKSYCVQRTNIQNLKAIHNGSSFRQPPWIIVFKERIYKIWKQFTTQHPNCP